LRLATWIAGSALHRAASSFDSCNPPRSFGWE
jgi:hypothetical protein